LLDLGGRLVLAVARHAACADHAPKPFFLHEEASRVGERVRDSMMLMARMNHDIGAVERRTGGVVIEKRAAGRQNIPRVVDVEIEHSQAKREVDGSDVVAAYIDRHELALGKHPPMIFELFRGIRRLSRIDELANRDDRFVMRGIKMADFVVGREHRGR
jgi:hypothetical protein